MRRTAEGSFRWVLTMFPTDAYAIDAERPSDDFAEFVTDACTLNDEISAAAWRIQSVDQALVIGWLDGKRHVHLRAEGIDLRFSIDSPRWINADGSRNSPDREIFIGPVEDSVEGSIRFLFPIVTEGGEVHDIRLRFEAGRRVDDAAGRNERFLLDTFDTDEGVRRLGGFAFGTNFGIQRFSKNILFDEKIGGTVNMAIGAGYPDTGSKNESTVH